MTTIGYKRLTAALVAAVVLLAAVSLWLFWELEWLRVRVAFAAEQTAIFEEMRTRALRSEPAEAAGCLEYVVNYYASGTKQEAGSRLDQIVERERARTVQDIIGHLRSSTGQDLGDDPGAWIERFARK